MSGRPADTRPARGRALARPARAVRPTGRLAALAVALALAGCAAAPAGDPAPVPLRIASDLDNPPFAWVDGDGIARGRDVEMMDELSRRIGRPLAWVRMPFDELLTSVARGHVDGACATLGITPERAESVDFTRPYFATELAVVVRRGPGEPASFADLAGRRVGAGTGTTAERAVRRRLPGATPVAESKSGLQGVARLASREVDALVMDAPAADALVARAPGALARLPGGLDTEDYAIALPKGRDALRSALDAALQAVTREGLRARWNARHGLHEASPAAGAPR